MIIAIISSIFLVDGWNRFDEELPLSSCVINFIVECFSLQETWLAKAPVALAFKIVAGKRMEEFFQVGLISLFVDISFNGTN